MILAPFRAFDGDYRGLFVRFGQENCLPTLSVRVCLVSLALLGNRGVVQALHLTRLGYSRIGLLANPRGGKQRHSTLGTARGIEGGRNQEAGETNKNWAANLGRRPPSHPACHLLTGGPELLASRQS